MQHFFEHTYQPLETLEKCRGLLRDGGMIVISLPNFGCLEAKVFKSDWSILDAPRHLYQFTPQTLTAVLAKAGFRVTGIRYQYIPMFFLYSIEYFFQTKGKPVSFPKSWYHKFLVKLAGMPLSARHIMFLYAQKVPRESAS